MVRLLYKQVGRYVLSLLQAFDITCFIFPKFKSVDAVCLICGIGNLNDHMIAVVRSGRGRGIRDLQPFKFRKHSSKFLLRQLHNAAIINWNRFFCSIRRCRTSAGRKYYKQSQQQQKKHLFHRHFPLTGRSIVCILRIAQK